jgi:hypothetical protein
MCPIHPICLLHPSRGAFGTNIEGDAARMCETKSVQIALWKATTYNHEQLEKLMREITGLHHEPGCLAAEEV